jgi:hypothetical protein
MFISRAASLIAPQTISGPLASAPVELTIMQRHGFVVVATDPKGGQVTGILEQSHDDELWAALGTETLVSGVAVIDYKVTPEGRGSGRTIYLRCTLRPLAGKNVTVSAVVVPVAPVAPALSR